MATHSAAELATHISGEGECHLVEKLLWLVVILDLDTVIGMDAASVRNIQIVIAEAVVIRDDIYPRLRRPLDLPADSFPRIRRAVRLPTVNQPWLDLQMSGGKNLNSQ